MKTAIFITAVVLMTGFIFRDNIGKQFSFDQSPLKKGKQKKSSTQKDNNTVSTPGLSVGKRWDLPEVLKEISGLAYIDPQRFACVQDEEGVVFIYNVNTQQIEQKISFAGPGDYEGITVKDGTAYVVRADGRLYEVSLNGSKKGVREFSTPLTIEHNVEGLCYDRTNNRLLLAIKNDEPGNINYKGIYSFDLSKNVMNSQPAYKIDLQSEAFKNTDNKKNKTLMPSGIAVHPLTHDIYMTDGPKSRLVMMDKSGTVKKVWQLGKEFAQPEGITFSPQGDIFISNEGTKQPGNIIKVEIE